MRAQHGARRPRLERIVRTEAARAALGTPTSTELLASLDALTTARRDRLAAASRELPLLYAITLAASGVALIVNAGALTFRASLRTSLLIVGSRGGDRVQFGALVRAQRAVGRSSDRERASD